MNLLLPESSRPALAPTGEQRLLLDGVPWASYLAIADALPDRPWLRLTYDRGRLELMTTSHGHEKYKSRLGRFLETLAEEWGLRIEPGGNMTFRREDLDRGLEPDQCYWIAHEEHMRARLDWDATRDPPPDLVIEVEISRTALDRMAIYSALGVPEVWRCDGETLRVELRQPDGTWQPSPHSPTFPGLAVAEVPRFLRPREDLDYLGQVRAFRAWVQEQRAGGSATGD